MRTRCFTCVYDLIHVVCQGSALSQHGLRIRVKAFWNRVVRSVQSLGFVKNRVSSDPVPRCSNSRQYKQQIRRLWVHHTKPANRLFEKL